MTAVEILTKAAGHMQGRASTYDKPEGERSMAQTVAIFNLYHGTELTEAQGWHLLQILKDVRLFARPGYHADSAEDCVAYAALKAEALHAGAVADLADSDVRAVEADWPNEQRRQDAEAEDEAFAAIEASQPKAGHDFPDAPDWDSHSWPQIVKDEDGRWWGVKAGWKMSISHGFKGDYFSILNGDGELLKRGSDPMNWRSSLQQRPYTGPGGVMLCSTRCEAPNCECLP